MLTRTRWQQGLAAILLVTAVHAAGGQAAGEQNPPAPPAATPYERQQGDTVWKLHEVGFTYTSGIAIFSCSAMRDRVMTIMRAIGARDDVEVRADGCSTSEIPVNDPFATNASIYNPIDPGNQWRTARGGSANPYNDRRQIAHVRIRAMWPTPMTDEIIEEIKRDQSRRELISRATGNPAARMNDPVVFSTQRQRVTLSEKTIGLDPAECELLEQMSAGVFRKLDVDIVSRRMNCDRKSISRIAPEITVETNLPVIYGTTTLPVIEEEGEE